MTHHIDRRAFIRRAAALATLLPSTARRGVTTKASPPIRLRVGLVAPDVHAPRPPGAPAVLPEASPPDPHAFSLGVDLGIDEARHAAQLFGGQVLLVPIELSAIGTTPVSAIVCGISDAAGAEAALHRAAAARIACLNAACTSNAVRANPCNGAVFHVVPSDAMYGDALRLTHAASGAWAAAWDPSLVRFGADTLNERFQARFGRPMTSDAWCGWIAVKMLWESALRARSAAPSALIAYLSGDATQFDGHKGRPLSFRAWDHQLRQPVYIMRREDGAQGGQAGPRVIAEAPTSSNPDVPSRELLDELGTSQVASACRLSP